MVSTVAQPGVRLGINMRLGFANQGMVEARGKNGLLLTGQ